MLVKHFLMERHAPPHPTRVYTGIPHYNVKGEGPGVQLARSRRWGLESGQALPTRSVCVCVGGGVRIRCNKPTLPYGNVSCIFSPDMPRDGMLV